MDGWCLRMWLLHVHVSCLVAPSVFVHRGESNMFITRVIIQRVIYYYELLRTKRRKGREKTERGMSLGKIYELSSPSRTALCSATCIVNYSRDG